MNWLKEIGAATTVEALLAIVNDFVLQHPEDFWSWIPRGSRPTLLASVAELHHWHRKLSDDLAGIDSPNVRMQDLGVFFLRAAARAVELEARPAPSNDAAAAQGEKAG